jgi:hypothetical protein
MTTKIDIFKMRAIFKSFWVRKLIGKLGVPYNRRLGVRGSPHPPVSAYPNLNLLRQNHKRIFGYALAGHEPA